jgi:peroxiredoxin
MPKPIALNVKAPDFSLKDAAGKVVRLSDYHGKKHVVLVFNRGFL